jgi:hypothetical protein
MIAGMEHGRIKEVLQSRLSEVPLMAAIHFMWILPYGLMSANSGHALKIPPGHLTGDGMQSGGLRAMHNRQFHT